MGATHRSPDNPASAREGKGETGTTRGRPTEQRAERGGLAGWQVGRPARRAVGVVVFRWGVGLVLVGC